MTLGELIKFLANCDPSGVVPFGFGSPHSYRGYYEDVAFQPAEGFTTFGEMLEHARSALGATYQGYKGGEFTMYEYTRVHIAEYGQTGEEIGPTLLRYMLLVSAYLSEEDK